MPQLTRKGPVPGAPESARLHPDLVPLLDRLRPLVADERSATIRARYDAGCILRLGAKRRKNGAPALARAVGLPSRLAAECSLVATRIGEDELAAFIAAAAARSPRAGMGWVHLARLAEIESPEDRAAWIARTAAEGLSVAALRRALAAEGVARHKDGVREGGGRPFKLPEDPVAAAAVVAGKVASFERFAGSAADQLGHACAVKLRAALLRMVDDLDARLATAEVLGEEVARG